MTKMKGGPADTGGPVEVPEQLSILPLRNSVLFPGSIIPIDVGRRKSVRLVEEAISKERPVIGILTQSDARTEDPAEGDMYMVGCAARILKVIKLAKDNFSRHPAGRLAHSQVAEYDGSRSRSSSARSQRSRIRRRRDVELDALVMNLKDIAKRVIKLMPELPKEAGALVDSVTEPGQLADLITSNLDIQVDEKQDVLETFDLKTRMRKVLQFLSRQLEVLEGAREDQHAGPGRDGPQPARVRAAPAAQGDQGRARRARRGGRRPRRVRGEDHGGEDAGRDREGRAQAARAAQGACSRRRRSTPSRGRTSSGSSSCRGRSRPRTSSTSRRRATSSTPITTISRR